MYPDLDRRLRAVKVTYDESVEAAYIYLTEIAAGGVATTVPGWPDSEAFMVNLDFDGDGRLVGIEVMGASGKLPPEFLTRFANRTLAPSE
jgi:uncharacterized protein YuzE